MEVEISSYLDRLKGNAKTKIAELLKGKSAISTVRIAFKDYFASGSSQAFHCYYSRTVSNRNLFLRDANFFGGFKQQYALQGIDNGYLEFLEKHKWELLKLIEAGNIADLYFKYFAYAKIKQKDGIKTKNLGSFFAKFVHTFKPEKYCALDNPIKKCFGLGNEVFMLRFLS